jgi:hypothetical protein
VNYSTLYSMFSFFKCHKMCCMFGQKNQRRYYPSRVMLHRGGTESHPCRKIKGGTESHRCRIVQNIRGTVFHGLIVTDYFLRTDVSVADLALHPKIMGGQKLNQSTFVCAVRSNQFVGLGFPVFQNPLQDNP